MTNVVHPEGVQDPHRNSFILAYEHCREWSGEWWNGRLGELRNSRLGEWWNGLSKKTQKYLKCFLYMLLTCVLVGVLLYIGWPADHVNNPSNPNLLVEQLADAAAYYRKNLDENVQPCDDFYSFVCKNPRSEYAKENKSRFDTMNMMGKSARLSLDDFLTKPLNASDSKMLRELKTFHQACINTTKVDAEGIEPVLALLKEIGGWPLLSNEWVLTLTESWEDIVASINRAGFAIQFPYYLYAHPVPKHTIDMAMILTPMLRARHHRILPDRIRTIDHVKRIAVLLNATNVRIEEDIKNCIVFESELYEITNSVTEDEKLYTIDDLIRDHPETPWESFFRNVFVSTSVKLSSNEIVLLSHSNYTPKVSELLKKTSVKIIRNYMVFLLIEEAIPVLPEKFREARKVFEHRMGEESRNVGCLEILIDKAPVSLGHLFIESYFDGPAKNKFHDLIKSVERQAHRFFDNITGMDSDAQIKMRERLIKLKAGISHPDDSADVMEELEFRSNDTTFANYRRLASGHRNFKYSRLRVSQKDYQRIVPFQYATDAETIYIGSIDATYIMAAIFQRPFFSTVQPMYLNYGGIGFVIAQEIAHGLDILSVCQTKDCLDDWRSREITECMETHYNHYAEKQLSETVDGRKTVREIIGDQMGLKLAYHAYEEFAKDSEEQLLPVLNYTRRQWFWINAATTLCSYETDASSRDSIATNKRSQAEARVNFAFANLGEFARDFECRNTSRMNSDRTCGFL